MMKKFLILTSALLAIGTGSTKAQVSIGKGSGNSTERPQGLLHLYGKSQVNDSTIRNMGFVIPKVDAVDSVKTPQGNEAVMGTLVFTVNDAITDKHDFAIPGGLRVKLKDGWSHELVEMSDITNYFDYEVYGGFDIRVKKVSAGNQYSLVIGSADESVYSAGANSSGKTGMGTTGSTTATFGMALAHRTKDISAGYEHALAVTKNGDVWSWGNGGSNRTGQTSTCTFPMRVKGLSLAQGDTVIRCEAGYENSLLLTKLGKVYYFGSDARGVNGTGSASTSTSSTVTPTQMNFGTDIIIDIALSSHSGAALTDQGAVYVWGNQEYGRLGNGNDANSVTGITKISFPEAIKQVAMGTNHGLAVSADGKTLYGWGAAQGWGKTTRTSTPADITQSLISGGFNPSTDSIVYIAASRFVAQRNPSAANTGGSIIITDKNVYAAGSDTNPSRLGLGYIPKSTNPMYSPNGTTANGFLPIYNKTIPPGTFFDQASIGVDHSLLKQTVAVRTHIDGTSGESGSYGYGMGNVSQNQLGAVSSSLGNLPIPSNIKK